MKPCIEGVLFLWKATSVADFAIQLVLESIAHCESLLSIKCESEFEASS